MMRRECLLLLSAAMLTAGCASRSAVVDSSVKAALAPESKLRAGFLLGPLYATRDPASGQLRGVAVELADALAQRLGVPLETLPQPNVATLLTGAREGRFDIVFTGINAERAAVLDFSAPFMEVEFGVLVRPGVPVATLDQMDRAGLRIGVLEKSGADAALSAQLKTTQVMRLPTLDALFLQLVAGQLDMVSATKARLFDEAAKLAGSRVLDGRVTVEPIGVGVPKARPAAAGQFVGRFVDELKSGGQVAAAIGRAQLRGVTVAPVK